MGFTPGNARNRVREFFQCYPEFRRRRARAHPEEEAEPGNVKFRRMHSYRSEPKASESSQSDDADHPIPPSSFEERKAVAAVPLIDDAPEPASAAGFVGGTVVSGIRESIVTVGDGNRVLIEQLHVHFEPAPEFAEDSEKKLELSRHAQGSVVTVSMRRSRELLLGKMHDFWIRGVLERNLHGAAAAQLGFEPLPQALSNPWELLVELVEPTCPELPLRPTIFDLYSASRGRLLVVGAAGCGKTTLLLQLARVLIERARTEDALPIPVILTLGTWASGDRIFEDWLERELSERYDAPARISKKWLQGGELILLLDGLEEIAPAERTRCIVAINAFLRDKPCGLAVCSREVEYSSASTESRLRLNAAVRVEPLSKEEIKSYVSRQGSRLVALQKALDADAQLLTLAQTPLFLNIMILAYQGGDELEATDVTLERKRDEVLRAYVQKMTKEGRRPTRFSARQTTHWLTNLASRMMASGVPVFDFHQLQADWLKNRREKVSFGILLQLTLRLFTALCFGLPTALNVSWAAGLTLACVGFLSPVRSKEPHRILPVRALGWSSSRFWQNLLPAFKNGLTWGFLWGGIHLLKGSAVDAVSLMFSIGLAGAVADSILGGLEAREVGHSTDPGMAIWKSAHSALLAGGISAAVGSLAAVLLLLAAKHFLGLHLNFAGTVILWLSTGFIITALQYGGRAFLKHWALRFLLFTEGSLPFNLQGFLDHVVRRTFMCRVGEGYVFIHRLPMEYFAARSIHADEQGEFAIRRRWYVAAAALLGLFWIGLAAISVSLIVTSVQITNLLKYGSAELQKGNFGEATSAFDSVIKLRERHPGSHLGRGYARFRTGQLDQAIADYSVEIAISPSDPEAYFFRGIALEQSGQLQQALRDLQSAADFKSQQPELSYEIGKAFIALGQPDKAQPYLAEYIRSASARLSETPEDTSLLTLRGTAYCWSQEYEKAMADFERVLSTNIILNTSYATGEWLQILRGRSLIGLGRYDDALALYSGLAEAPATRESGIRGIASVYFLRGQRLGAIKDFEAAIQAFEQVKNSLTMDERLVLGSSYHSVRRETDAIATAMAVTKAAADDSYRARAWGSLSFCYLFERKFEEAISSANEALRINPGLTFVLSNVAHAHLFSGRLEEARRIYRDNLHLSLDGKSWPHFILKDFEELKSRGISHPAMEEIGREMNAALDAQPAGL